MASDHKALDQMEMERNSISEYNRITNSMRPHNHGLLRVFYQIKLLLWKRYIESTKTKVDILKVILPPLLFFSLLLLIYSIFPFFSGGGIEAFFVPLGFWIYIQRLVVQIMFEKGTRLQESMRMMGLLDSSYWISYFISDGIILGFLLSFLCTILSTGGLFNDGNFGDVLGLLFVFCLSSVSFGFFLTAFSDSPQFGTQVTLVVLMGMYIVYIIIFLAGKNTIPMKACEIIVSFFPPIALQLGCQSFLKSYDGIPRSTICGIMFADIFIYAVLAWYFTQIWPSANGIRKPFYFPLLPSYWFPESKQATDNCLSEQCRIAAEESPDENIPVEEANENLLGPPTILVKNLRKTFGPATVINDLNFKMYENQIFALLGHNGAGKTTTINVLTGLIAPDIANDRSLAYIYGRNIAKDMDTIRLSLGICPQHDVLFEKLSVKEHILFFSQLKGYSYDEAHQEAVSLTKLFHLGNRLDHLGTELSGGQRRKLSVAIAVCGGSKFVVLDEPTAGMDPLARRELWDLLASLRHGRSMLLTTHYMDEADVLGDRIGIMSLGKMQCCGTPHFLKTTLGAGYRLIFDKTASMSDNQVGALTQYVNKFIPEAAFKEEIGQDTIITFTLPFNAVGKFGKFFQSLEKDLPSLAVTGFNLTITTLEDVFLKVGEDHTVTPHSDANNIGIGARTYQTTFFSQVIGIIGRRLLYATHDFLTFVLLILPLAGIIVAAILYKNNVISSDKQISDMASTGITIAGYIGAPGMIAEFLVRERSDKLRNVLNVMGCSYPAYWVGSFIADYILMAITLGVMFISWGAADIEHFYGSDGGLNFFLWILFVFEMVSFSYACSFMFTSPKSCIWTMPVLVLLLLIMPNILLLIGLQIAKAVGTSIKSSDQAGILLWGMVFLSPYGAVFCACLNVVNNFSDIITSLPNVGACIAIMIIESALFLAFTYYTDIQSSIPLQALTDPTTDEAALELLDEDVKAERRRTLENKEVVGIEGGVNPDVTPPLTMKRLRKFFPPKVQGRRGVMAVEDLALTVDKGEIFGLLGANGAGKTTALSLLTRLLVPTSGDAFLAGHSILSDFTKAATHLGVVTQNNSLWDKLSVEDHLYLFARLRGVPEDLVKQVVSGTIDQLELTPHRKKLAMNLSGGMKRKLCVAIALIGDPEVVLLDEPSAGLDPVSRRNLWTVILRTMSNRSVILTTHSMEEAEALCRRIGIMVQGQVRALGSKLHLKNKYGSGFELTVKLQAIDFEKEIDELGKFVTSLFPSAFVLAQNGGLVTYQIPKEEMKMSVAFEQLHAKREALCIEEFTVAQPTLEQVFIRIVHKFTPNEQTVTEQVIGGDEVVQEVNKCGCTDPFTRGFTILTTILFIVFWVIGIAVFGRSDEKGSSAFIVVGIVFLVIACVGCNLLFCACCRPPKGGDE